MRALLARFGRWLWWHIGFEPDEPPRNPYSP